MAPAGMAAPIRVERPVTAKRSGAAIRMVLAPPSARRERARMIHAAVKALTRTRAV